MPQELAPTTIATPGLLEGAAIAPLAVGPGEANSNECSLGDLAALADAAFRAGDHASAEAFVRRLYSEHDRQQATLTARGFLTTLVPRTWARVKSSGK